MLKRIKHELDKQLYNSVKNSSIKE